MSGVETPRTHAGARLLRAMGLGASVRTLHAKERRARMLRAILDIEYEAAALAAAPPSDSLDVERPRLVCSLCLFVGESDEPEPITVLNGQLVCEPHNGYFQGGDHVQAIIAWKHAHAAPEVTR